MGMDRFAPVTGSLYQVQAALAAPLDRPWPGSSLKEGKSDTQRKPQAPRSLWGSPSPCTGGKPYRCQTCQGCLRAQARSEQDTIGLVVDATANSWFVTRTITDAGLRRVRAAIAAEGLEQTPRNIDRGFRKMVISPALKRLRRVLAYRNGRAVKLHAWSKAELGSRTHRFHVHMVLSCDEVVTKEQIKSALMGKGADGALRGFGGWTDCRALKSLRPSVQDRLVRLGRGGGKGVATYLAGYVNKQLGVFRAYRSDHYGQVAVDRYADLVMLQEEHSDLFRSSLSPDYPVLKASGRYIPRKLAKPVWRRVHRLVYEAYNGAGSFSAVEDYEASQREARAKWRRKIALFDLRYPSQPSGGDMSKGRDDARDKRREAQIDEAVVRMNKIRELAILHGEEVQLDGIEFRLKEGRWSDRFPSILEEFTRFEKRMKENPPSHLPPLAGPVPEKMVISRVADPWAPWPQSSGLVVVPASAGASDAEKSLFWIKMIEQRRD